MQALTLISIIFFILLTFKYSLDKTIFQISLRNSYLGGLLIFREVFIYILLGSIIIETTDLNKLKTTYVNEVSIEETTPIILATLITLILSIGFFSKTVFKKYLTFKNANINYKINQSSSINLIRAIALLLLTLILLAHLNGVKHAFISALFSGENLLTVRMANKFESSAPPHIITYTRFSLVILSISIGIFGLSNLYKSEKIFYPLLLAYSATLPGDKAPLIEIIILYLIGKIYRVKYNSRQLLIGFILFPILIIPLIYGLALTQYPDMDNEKFIEFILDRLGIGQIQGVYEQFSLKLRDINYIYTEIPLSGIFGEEKIFSKDLMMLTYGYNSYFKEVGVMNSYFIGEALAIGGYFLVFISPIIVAFNFCLICASISWMFSTKLKLPPRESRIITALFASSILMFTGDFNGLLLGKKFFSTLAFLILLLGTLSVITRLRTSLLTTRIGNL